MRALLSVYDKSGLGILARGLAALGWELISTGGTLAYLRALGLEVTPVSDVTGFPEILDGRVKTLHPHIHGGILARRDLPEHLDALNALGITGIDLVAGNLYPFESTVSKPECTLTDALEQIDIGGPAMIRAAAKNFTDVLIVTNPDDYLAILSELQGGMISTERRRSLAARAFQHVSAYDALVADYLRDTSEPFPDELTVPGRKSLVLRYGENPHQQAAAYHRTSITRAESGVLDAVQLHGKDLSYNNILDTDAAFLIARSFSGIACSIIKHATPCGVAVCSTPANAFRAALAGDPVSAYGGIVAINHPIDEETAERMAHVFFEVIIAPNFSDEALRVLKARKNLRLLSLDKSAWYSSPAQSVRSIAGGILVQDADRSDDNAAGWSVATETHPTPEQWAELAFAWQTCRFVRSNAVVLTRETAITGVGPGQPNRLDSVRIAITRAGDAARGSVLASDAFFPFADGVEVALDAGIAAIVQPGGSVRDNDVIAACDRAGIPMLFTGVRHFLH